MTKQLASQIDIAAPPETVWHILADFDAYSEWNPFIVRADGQPVERARLTLRMQPVGGRAMTLKPRVLEVIPGRSLRWLGRLGIPGLMDAEHLLVVEPHDGGTRFSQTEQFRGILVPFVARTLDRGTLPAFHGMNEALKERAERIMASHLG